MRIWAVVLLTLTASVVGWGASSRHDQELKYIHETQSLILPGLIELYKSDQTQMTYASFTTQQRPGPDGGFGLHVVKKLERETETILVNEHWNVLDGEIHLPEEIRVRVRPKAGLPKAEFNEIDPRFLVARYRVAWDFEGTPHLYEDPIYDENDRRIKRRVGISVLSCIRCHAADDSRFRAKYKSNQDPDEPGTIVHPRYFQTPLEDTLGYQELMNIQKNEADKKRLSEALLQRARLTMSMPELVPVLQEKLKVQEFQFMGEDDPRVYDSEQTWIDEEHGYYTRGGITYRDSLYDILENTFGKFRWWKRDFRDR